MASKKEFDIKYTPRRNDSKFILFAELQEDYFGVRDERGITRFGAEIIELDILHPTKYFEKYDALYYENFIVMVEDMSWLAKVIGERPTTMIFHEIDNINIWLNHAKTFEKGVKNPLLLPSHPDYKFTYDLMWR